MTTVAAPPLAPEAQFTVCARISNAAIFRENGYEQRDHTSVTICTTSLLALGEWFGLLAAVRSTRKSVTGTTVD